MSCVLRMSAANLSIDGLVPYRVENGTEHFQVSEAGFNDVKSQIVDAVTFLRANQEHLQNAMGQPGANGVLDFAVEWREVAVQCDGFPADLVREAGRLGLALEFSHYPRAEVPRANAYDCHGLPLSTNE